MQDHADLHVVPGAPRLASTTALSGLLLPAKRRIWVNATESRRSPGRRAFTIAHEIGHWQLHCGPGHEADERFCRSGDVGATSAQLRQSPALEREANRFAAALLMPEHLVRSEVRARGVNVLALAAAFGVSGQAMQIRLEALRLLPDYLL